MEKLVRFGQDEDFIQDLASACTSIEFLVSVIDEIPIAVLRNWNNDQRNLVLKVVRQVVAEHQDKRSHTKNHGDFEELCGPVFIDEEVRSMLGFDEYEKFAEAVEAEARSELDAKEVSVASNNREDNVRFETLTQLDKETQLEDKAVETQLSIGEISTPEEQVLHDRRKKRKHSDHPRSHYHSLFKKRISSSMPDLRRKSPNPSKSVFLKTFFPHLCLLETKQQSLKRVASLEDDLQTVFGISTTRSSKEVIEID